MKTFKQIIKEANYDGYKGKHGFKDKNTASKGGQTAGKHKQMKAGSDNQEAMIDAALKQDKKAFDKVAKKNAKLNSKIFNMEVKPEKMWSVAKAKAMQDGSYFKMSLKQRKKL